MKRPPLTVAEVLAWADAHRRRTGSWPTTGSGPVLDAPGETWRLIDAALRDGSRGLPGGSSLCRLLVQQRGKPPVRRAPLTVGQVLAWADRHHARTGRWPTASSGVVDGAPEETWCAVNSALHCGCRGLPGGDSLARLLDRERRQAAAPAPGGEAVQGVCD